MDRNRSRRRFLKAGLVLPAGLISTRVQAHGQVGSIQSSTPVSHRILGKTGLRVSSVGFGTGYNPKPDVIARAIDLGVNYFDTSPDYGESERILGGAIRGKRDKILVVTKTNGRDKAQVLKEMDNSLRALGTDHLDVYLLHAVDMPARVSDELIDALEMLKKQGKTRYIGLSTHDPANMLDLVLSAGRFDVVLTTYSYAIGGFFRNVAIKKMHEAGIGVVAMKVTRAMTGITMMEQFAKGVRREDMDFSQKLTGEACVAAIKWVLTNPAIATTVPNHADLSILEMNVKAMSEEYTPKDERLLYAKNESIRPFYCRMCYACRGQCPKGMPVTDVLRFLAYNDFGGNFHHARSKFHELPLEVRKLRCHDCAACLIQCPNGVAVRDRLIRAQSLLG